MGTCSRSWGVSQQGLLPGVRGPCGCCGAAPAQCCASDTCRAEQKEKEVAPLSSPPPRWCWGCVPSPEAQVSEVIRGIQAAGINQHLEGQSQKVPMKP